MPPPPAPTGASQFHLTAASAGIHPFALGFGLRRGDVPSGRVPVVDLPGAQIQVMTHWPDGSAQWIVIAGQATLAAGTTLTVAVADGVATAAGMALGTADLRDTGITARVDAGSFGSASWSAADWDSPARTWISGPAMSSWLYRKAIGSDAHLVAWLEVRLFESGAVEVLPWIENGHLNVAAPSSRNATYVFTLGGSERFRAAIDLPNHCRGVLVSGSALSHWLDTDPGVVATHDTDYLQATELVPTYYGDTAASSTAVAALPTAYAPLQQGSYPTGMGAAGYHPSIGLLPEWDVLYLTTGGIERTWRSLQRNAYSAGRYGVHFRDETTRRPLRFSTYPNLCMGSGSAVSSTGASSTGSYTPAAGGTAPATYASSHHPSMGFMAGLLTGRCFHVETLQFVATANYLKNTDFQRQFSDGVLLTQVGANTPRGAAWALRTLAQAACLTPEADALKGQFVASLEANLAYYHGTYVAQANNPFGWVMPYSDYTGVGDGVYYEATWMQDFVTAAFGYMKALGLPLSATASSRLDAFFAWKAASVVGRFGGTGISEYLYRDAAVYTIAIAPTDTPDFAGGTGPWFANWGALYTATFPTSPGPRSDGGLRGGNFPDATSYWGNLLPALSYAARFDVPGADAALARLTSASNWSDLADGFDDQPVWGVRPANPT